MKREIGGFSTGMRNCRMKDRRFVEAEGQENGIAKKSGKGREGGIMALFWNVAVTKSMQKEDWEFVRRHEIIEMVETWEEEGRGHIEKELKEFWIKKVLAHKEDKKRESQRRNGISNKEIIGNRDKVGGG